MLNLMRKASRNGIVGHDMMGGHNRFQAFEIYEMNLSQPVTEILQSSNATLNILIFFTVIMMCQGPKDIYEGLWHQFSMSCNLLFRCVVSFFNLFWLFHGNRRM